VLLILAFVPPLARGDEVGGSDTEIPLQSVLQDRWRLLEIQGVPPPDPSAEPLLATGQPFASAVQVETTNKDELRSLYGWIVLPREPVDVSSEIWMRPAFVARALPGVTGVQLLEQEHGCALLTMRSQRQVLRRTHAVQVRLRRCAQKLDDGVRWVARTEQVDLEESGRSADLPSAFAEVIEIRSDPDRGWVLGMYRVELGRRIGRVFSTVYSDELRAGLARDLRHAAPVLSGAGALEVERTFRIE
jgi:hypothetical protein